MKTTELKPITHYFWIFMQIDSKLSETRKNTKTPIFRWQSPLVVLTDFASERMLIQATTQFQLILSNVHSLGPKNKAKGDLKLYKSFN